MEFSLSQIDTDRFGVNTAKAYIDAGDSVDLLLNKSKANSVELLIVRAPVECHSVIRELESNGASLADTLIYHRKAELEDMPVEFPLGLSPRDAGPSDAESLFKLAGKAFSGYSGHYHTDPRLNRNDADEVYASWARDCCLFRFVADKVFVVEYAGQIVGFIALQKVKGKSLDCVLCAVDPAFRGQNTLSGLLRHSMSWARASGFSTMEYSTHTSNIAAQKVITRMGFVPVKSVHTFHKWFEVDPKA